MLSRTSVGPIYYWKTGIRYLLMFMQIGVDSHRILNWNAESRSGIMSWIRFACTPERNRSANEPLKNKQIESMPERPQFGATENFAKENI